MKLYLYRVAIRLDTQGDLPIFLSFAFFTV